MTWASLFERATCRDVTVADVQAALAHRRTDGGNAGVEDDEVGEEGEERDGEDDDG